MNCMADFLGMLGFAVIVTFGCIGISLLCFSSLKRAAVTAVVVAFLIGDCMAYSRARFPERMSSIFYKFPGGGYVALLRLGAERTEP